MPRFSISWRPSLSRASFEKRSERALRPILRSPLGVSSSLPSLLLMSPASSSCWASFESCSRLRAASSPRRSRARSTSTSASAPGEDAPRQHLLELVEVAELVEHLGGLGEAERVLAGEVVAPLPAHLGEELLEVAAELVHLPAQVHVLQQRLGQALELGPLLGGHRVEHRLHGRHPLGHQLEELVEGLRTLGEEVAVALHELLEGGLGVLPRLLLGEEVVEVVQHVLHALHGLGGHLLHGPGHLVEVALRHLLPQLVHELVEALPRLAGGELVLLELLHHPGQVGREHVELEVALGDHLVGDLLPALVAALLRLSRKLVEALALHVEHLAE